MKFVASALTLLSLLHSASAFGSGAGRCAVGEASPAGRHADPAPGLGGELSNGSYMVTVNGVDLIGDTIGTATVTAGEDFEIVLSGPAFRGFLIMLAGEPEEALQGGDGSQQALGSDCVGTASITQTDRELKDTVVLTGNIAEPTSTTIEANVVVINRGGESDYYYSAIPLEVVEPVTLPETDAPVTLPETDAPVTLPETDAPTGTEAPTLASIAEIAAATPELSTLVSLLPAQWVEALSGEGTYTVFAPVNDAFAALPQDVIASLGAPGNEAALEDVLTYHVLGIVLLSSDLTEGAVVTALNGDELTVTSLDPVTINDSAVVTVADIAASNGVVHLIDAVLIPPEDAPVEETAEPTLAATTTTPTDAVTTIAPTAAPLVSIAEIALATEDLSTLVSLLPNDLVDALSGDGTYTVFAPVNSAFEDLPREVVESLTAPGNEAALRDVLTYHVLGMIVTSSDLEEGAMYMALNGDELTVTSLDPVTINESVVIAADIAASNGVVHLIDAVLIPPIETLAPETEVPTPEFTANPEDMVNATEPPMVNMTEPPMVNMTEPPMVNMTEAPNVTEAPMTTESPIATPTDPPTDDMDSDVGSGSVRVSVTLTAVVAALALLA